MQNRNEEILKSEQVSTNELVSEVLKLPEDRRRDIYMFIKGAQHLEEMTKLQPNRPAV